jgi:aminoglycoside 3-N-acetyltransferase
MVSLPYTTSTYEYLKRDKVFDVRRTTSRMGLISETFRRRQGIRRSLHPTHPVLADGPDADWIVAEHDQCLYPCGPGSPFEKLSLLDGKVVFYNAPVTTMTFFHYLEHMAETELDFPLYSDGVFDVPAIDGNGRRTTVKTRVFSIDAVSRRQPMMLWAELEKRSQVKKAKVGNSYLTVVHVKDAIACTQDMIRAGVTFYAGT